MNEKYQNILKKTQYNTKNVNCILKFNDILNLLERPGILATMNSHFNYWKAQIHKTKRAKISIKSLDFPSNLSFDEMPQKSLNKNMANYFLNVFIFTAIITITNGQETLLNVKTFQRTLDCAGRSGCALDESTESLEDIRNELHCAFACLIKKYCVNFNYLVISGSCLLFNRNPFKIENKVLCSSFDVNCLI